VSIESKEPGHAFRCLVLGCGSIGTRHLRNLLALGLREIVAYDPIPARRAAIQRELGISVPTSVEAALDSRPEVAVIATPPQDHVELAGEAVRRGCHVLIEKPLAIRLEGVPELCAGVDRQRRRAMVACNMRFHPGPAAVKRLLNDGAIGSPIAARIYTGSYLPRWRPGQDYRQSYSASAETGGAVLDCIHEIDLALWYLGPARVTGALTAPAQSLGLQTDGVAEILLQHGSGAITSVHLNFVQREYRRGCQIIGDRGTLAWDFGSHAVQRFDEDGRLAEELPEPPSWELNNMYVDELRHFLDAAEFGKPTMNPITEAMQTLRIALESRAKGRAAC
jgi:predicted dehydrogenase